MLESAFKEWAVICEALGQGRQSIILRKGGIEEPGGEFGVAETRFWLYPTWTHQQETDVNDATRALLADVQPQRPPAGTVRLQYWAELTGLYRIGEVVPALMLSHLHGWSDETVEKRFVYRTPGLNVLVVRVYRAPQVHEIAELPEYAGCRSWVALQQALPTDGSTPVLDDESFRIVTKQLDALLNPTALA
jgi:hypothetical protein